MVSNGQKIRPQAGGKTTSNTNADQDEASMQGGNRNEVERPRDDTFCDAQTLNNITRMLALAKDSGIEMSTNRYSQTFLKNALDIQPAVPLIFEPAQSFKPEPLSEPESDAAEEQSMFDQVAKRDFVVRRGRNNRILMRSIMKNVFDEKNEDQFKMPNPNKGQRHYVDKYNKIWR